MRRAEVVIPSHCPISAALLVPVPKELLSAPLDYIAAEHARQRCVCAYLKRMAAERVVPRADAAAISAFMAEDLRFHHEDEDVDLFPALRKRALREDALDTILERLTDDHATIDRLARSIVLALTRQQGDGAAEPDTVSIDKAASQAMTAYAAALLQHLSVENSIVLVFARKRLTASDLANLSRNMIARRGGAVCV